MEQYDRNVTSVMEFLKKENFSNSVINQHRICYREFRKYLIQESLSYSYDIVYKWLESNQKSWNYRQYTGWRHCLAQLNDIYLHGNVTLEHLGSRQSAYALLCPSLKSEVDEYLQSGLISICDERYRTHCSRFMIYLQDKGLTSIRQLTYDILFQFHEEDYHRSSKSKDIYEDLIRGFLKYHASKKHCSHGLAFALNKQLIHQIVKIEHSDISFDVASKENEIDWNSIESFLDEMKKTGYGKTVLKSSKHTLTLLYIFLDMHQLPFDEKLIWNWFDILKTLLGNSWKQVRRSLYQYLIYTRSGKITTKMTGSPNKISSMERLSDWIRIPLKNYLNLLEREGWKESTISMHRSSNLRFAQYLQNISVNSFSEITPELLQDFNRQDIHSTTEGKAAYNCRIRGFLIYLNEEGMISNPLLYKALPTLSAAKNRIVDILSEDDVKKIWSVDIESLTPQALRDYAMICIGLTMGFRASDIVRIRFQDINWKEHSIGLIQLKTGKQLVLPMPIRVGNILFRYLCCARPKSQSSYIFISHKAPYDKLHRCVCRKALNRILPQRETSNNGFHVIRKTFATNLLRGNMKLSLIADSLGHTTESSIHKYLSLDEERMRMCPLSLKDSGISWKGGVFNV